MYGVDSTGPHTAVVVNREQFICTYANVFCLELYQWTDTHEICPFTLDAIVDCLRLLQNAQIVQHACAKRAGHAVKGLVISMWLIVCFEAHNNKYITPYLLARKSCRSLRRAAIELGHNSQQGSPSRRLLEISLVFWERRLRKAYSDGKSYGYVQL